MGLLADQLRLALTATRYFTRLPVPRWTGYSERQLNDAVRYFPLVGILVGLITGGVYLLAISVFPQPLAVLLAMVSGVLLTGGFHEDGLQAGLAVAEQLGGVRRPWRVAEESGRIHLPAPTPGAIAA